MKATWIMTVSRHVISMSDLKRQKLEEWIFSGMNSVATFVSIKIAWWFRSYLFLNYFKKRCLFLFYVSLCFTCMNICTPMLA